MKATHTCCITWDVTCAVYTKPPLKPLRLKRVSKKSLRENVTRDRFFYGIATRLAPHHNVCAAGGTWFMRKRDLRTPLGIKPVLVSGLAWTHLHRGDRDMMNPLYT